MSLSEQTDMLALQVAQELKDLQNEIDRLRAAMNIAHPSEAYPDTYLDTY